MQVGRYAIRAEYADGTLEDSVSLVSSKVLALRGAGVIAYLHKNHKRNGGGFVLAICARPCNGAEFQDAERVLVADKRAARALCKARGALPYNF